MRWHIVFLVAALLSSRADRAEAQVARDDWGFPLRVVTLSLEKGKTYQFRTDFVLTSIGAGVPDSVMVLREDTFLTEVADTVAGADGCVGTIHPSGVFK